MKDEFKDFTDEELIEKLRQGEKGIEEYLCDKYKDLVKAKAKSMFILGGDSEDLIQEGMIGLFKAVRDYDCGRDAAFSTFAELCINRQIYKALQASNRKKNIPLNSYISLYGEKESEEGAFNPLENIVDNSKPGPEELILDRERVDYLEQVIEKELSSFENEVLELMLTGLNYVEIAHILGKTDKSVDNCIQRIKGKIRKIL